MPAFGFSLWMIATGVILMLGAPDQVRGFNMDAVGVIVIITGCIGMMLSLLFWTPFAPFNRRFRG